jgi:hypothetical protein
MPLTKPGASEMNNQSRDNSSEPGYAAANSLRLRSVSRDGGDLSMLCGPTPDQLLTPITIYWVTGPSAYSARGIFPRPAQPATLLGGTHLQRPAR